MPGTPEPFRKDLAHANWAEIFSRQATRAHLLVEWFEALRLRSGDRVLEVGSGPGYVSLALAERVGPAGIVHAIDKSEQALAHLEALQAERRIANIQRICSDAATLEPGDLRPDSALITMVLHHADDPTGILGNVARLLPANALAVVSEFHPEGPCEHRPPREHRLSPEQVRAWCEEAGFVFRRYRRQSPEHYMLLCSRRS
jgi:ubiquinone/menaquinone biosynthesis C-methylase UbiE